MSSDLPMPSESVATAAGSTREAATVLEVQQVSKCYRIYTKPHHRLLQAVFRGRRTYFRDFWALSDVSLTARRGQTLGIVGRNGSGKSTLLQIIAGTLTPTSGSVRVRGRVAALLELGAGFNPEFTGRENARLNATILGFSNDEITARLPQVIEFSALGDFIDQPVKTYSSGMFARLAFAVAINVDPDILIIDEALAVGDAGFQLKCMLKMRELQERGTTIIFVSHDTGAVVRLCDRAIVLEKGRVIMEGDDVLSCVKTYERVSRNASDTGARPAVAHVDARRYGEELRGIEETRFGNGDARYLNVSFVDDAGEERAVFSSGEFIEIRAIIDSQRSIDAVVNGFTLKNRAGVDIWGDNNVNANLPMALAPGLNRLSYRFRLNLPAGEYFLYIGLADVSTGERIELDQRWPVRRLTVLSTRHVLGHVFAPADIELTALGANPP